MKKLTWKQWQKRKQVGDGDLYFVEAVALERRAERGDSEAQEILDDSARTQGYRDNKEYMHKVFNSPELQEQVRQIMVNNFGESGAADLQMLHKRMNDPAIQNDLVLGLAMDSLRKSKMTAREFLKAVNDRKHKRISLPENEPTVKQDAAKGATWCGNGKPPETKADKIRAIQAWDEIPKDERPRLEDWLIKNLGTDPATGELLVPESTFHGWRKLKKS
jgi:hypothetical protein